MNQSRTSSVGIEGADIISAETTSNPIPSDFPSAIDITVEFFGSIMRSKCLSLSNLSSATFADAIAEAMNGISLAVTRSAKEVRRHIVVEVVLVAAVGVIYIYMG